MWSEQVVPRITNKVLASAQHQQIRQRVCSGLAGEVVEIGFGSGLNVAHYPAAVQQVTAVEPSDVAWRLSGPARASSSVPVVRAGLDGQRLPFADASFDSALSTWTMCTIPDVGAALRELRRVLRPGGQLRFVEHGAAPDENVLRWQKRIDPVQRRVFAGCHPSRPIEQLLASAGLPVVELDRYYVPRGRARSRTCTRAAASSAPAESAATDRAGGRAQSSTTCRVDQPLLAGRSS